MIQAEQWGGKRRDARSKSKEAVGLFNVVPAFAWREGACCARSFGLSWEYVARHADPSYVGKAVARSVTVD
jgi:hypothetical protein